MHRRHQHDDEGDACPAGQRGHRAAGDVEVGEHADEAEEDGGEADDPDDARRVGVLPAEEHVDDHAGQQREDREAREPDGGDKPERLGQGLADADAGAGGGDKLREGHGHQRPGQEHRDVAGRRPGRVEAGRQVDEEMAGQEYVDPAQRRAPGERADRQHGVAQGDQHRVEPPSRTPPCARSGGGPRS